MRNRQNLLRNKSLTFWDHLIRELFYYAVLQMHHGACTYEVFDNSFFLEKHRDNNRML